MSKVQSSQALTEKPDLIVIAGPTASGKTDVEEELCERAGHLPPRPPRSQDMTHRDLEKLFKRIR